MKKEEILFMKLYLRILIEYKCYGYRMDGLELGIGHEWRADLGQELRRQPHTGERLSR